MKKIFLALLVLQLIACGQSDSAKHDTSVEQTSIELAKAEVLAGLKNRESAKFKDVEFFAYYTGSENGQRTLGQLYNVCGQVNAKNSFGGYTGYTRFVVAIFANEKHAIDVRMLDSDDYNFKESDDAYYIKSCRNYY